MFLLIDDYKGSQVYKLFFLRDRAIDEAKKLAAYSPQDWVADYGDGDKIIFGKRGGEPSWHVELREIHLEAPENRD